VTRDPLQQLATGIMSDPQAQGQTGGVPVYDAVTQCPNPAVARSFSPPTRSVQGRNSGDRVGAPDSGGPDDRELLGPREDSGGVRPGQPNPDHGSAGGGDGVRLDGYTPPLTRSPSDVWHSEEYLLRWLVVTHGWRWEGVRLLRGPNRFKAVRSFMHPEGEPQP